MPLFKTNRNISRIEQVLFKRLKNFLSYGKKRNKRGLNLINVQKGREQICVKRGRPRLPKYLLDLEEVSLQEETIIEPPRLKIITGGRNLTSEILKTARWIVNVPYFLKSYEDLVIKHMKYELLIL